MSRDAPPLQHKLLVRLLVPLLVLLLSSGVAGYLIAGRLSNDVYNRELLEIARELTLHLSEQDGRVRLDLAPAAERLLLLDQDDKVFYRIATDRGDTIAGEAALPVPDRPAEGAQDARFYRAELAGEAVWVVLVRERLPGAGGGSEAVVQVAETGAKRTTLTRQIVLSIVLPQIVLIGVAGVLVWMGVARGLAPLRRLSGAIAKRSDIDLSPIEERSVPGEVRPLLHAINELMVRLNAVLSFQKRFIADAAHQLRTPVAGLKVNIEVGLRETDPSAIKRSLAQTFVGVERLSRLVSQLLSLARNEPNSARPANFLPLDLNRLVFNAAMEWVPEALKKQIDLGFEGPETPVTILGDAPRLAELVNNLLDNAIRYSREGGRVTVRVSPDPPPAFSVGDDGPRIPPEERERIFERFHRLLGTQTDGSGLGLAIVREIAAIHGARVSLGDDADGVGNRFTVSFPLERGAGD
jgi:two-component system sensor histidine kinase TctE